ncbi:MAG: hypothetical protein DRZ82_02040 [Thermoprotei archaeon]|nr:MAG: hypothetical protein DRZ82_02040 [Thermoprotei archaeon]
MEDNKREENIDMGITRRLPFKEIWLSLLSFIIIVVDMTTPILLASSFFYVIPSGGGIISRRITTIPVSQYKQLYKEVIQEAYRIAENVVLLNKTVVLNRLMKFFNTLTFAHYVLIGIFTVIAIARPLEYKYFFLEVLSRGSRLKVFAERWSLLLLLSVFSSTLTSLTVASIYYVNSAFPSFLECYHYAFMPLTLTSVSALSLATFVSTLTKRMSDSLLLFLAISVLIILIGSVYEKVASIILTALALYKNIGFLEYVLFMILVNLVNVIRVVSLEY